MSSSTAPPFTDVTTAREHLKETLTEHNGPIDPASAAALLDIHGPGARRILDELEEISDEAALKLANDITARIAKNRSPANEQSAAGESS